MEKNESWYHVPRSVISNAVCRIKAWCIAGVCIGALHLASAAAFNDLPGISCLILCGVGGVLLSCRLTVLTCIDQDDAWPSFGHP